MGRGRGREGEGEKEEGEGERERLSQSSPSRLSQQIGVKTELISFAWFFRRR